MQIKKFRKLHGQFIVEGLKSVIEVLKSEYTVKEIIVNANLPELRTTLSSYNKHFLITEATANEISSASYMENNETAIAIVSIKQNDPLIIKPNQITLCLDGIQDPGNFGTIIRTAEWFGIDTVICSNETVDLYNPKVISSSMGSFTRTKVYYENLESVLKTASNEGIKIYGAFMSGSDIKNMPSANGLIIFGNESNGITVKIEKMVNEKINIKRIGGAESLNVGVACGIILHHFCN
ncbi:MAG: RNA methyltransferase [Bacteroidota bacterium]|nr:RNA methyltransferase [Bacteroidota bacterium]